MRNIQRGEHSFEHDGETYSLVFDVNALCEAEGAANMPMAQLLAALSAGAEGVQNIYIRSVRALLYGMLFRNHQATLAQAGDLIGSLTLEKLLPHMQICLEAAQPEKRPGEAEAKTTTTDRRTSRKGGSSVGSKLGSIPKNTGPKRRA